MIVGFSLPEFWVLSTINSSDRKKCFSLFYIFFTGNTIRHVFIFMYITSTQKKTNQLVKLDTCIKSKQAWIIFKVLLKSKQNLFISTRKLRNTNLNKKVLFFLYSHLHMLNLHTIILIIQN